MKKFSDLKVGDELPIFYAKQYHKNYFFESEIINITQIKKAILITTNWAEFIVNDIEKDFYITEADFQGIQEAIATSMDRLLLECSE